MFDISKITVMFMIRFVTAENLSTRPMLRATMFRDRADQFFHRLRWDISINESGEEIDQYDALGPIYVMAETALGRHEGSMRFLPTLGQTMVNDYFQDLTGQRIESRFIWECTRFCLGPHATRQTAPKLLAAGGKLMEERGVRNFVGVFDEHTERVYRIVGAKPELLGKKDTPYGVIGVGLWEFDDETYDQLLRKAGISAEMMDIFYRESTGTPDQVALSA